MLSAEPDLESAKHEDVKIVVATAIVGWIALLAAAMRRGSHGTEDVDHGTAAAVSGRSWSA